MHPGSGTAARAGEGMARRRGEEEKTRTAAEAAAAVAAAARREEGVVLLEASGRAVAVGGAIVVATFVATFGAEAELVALFPASLRDCIVTEQRRIERRTKET